MHFFKDVLLSASGLTVSSIHLLLVCGSTGEHGHDERSGSQQGYFPAYVDRSLRLTLYWADCELQLANDVKAARVVWEEALKTQAGR